MNRILPLIAIALFVSSCDSGPRELVLARPDSQIDEDIAANLAQLLAEDAAIGITLSADALSGADALGAVISGQADIALVSNDQPFHEDIATVMPLYATVLHIVYRGDLAPVDGTELLRDAVVFAGSEGSASRRVFERLVSNIDLGDQGFRYVRDRNEAADVAVVFAPIAPDRLREFPDVKLWSMDTPQGIGAGGPVDAVVLMNPHFRPFIIPVGTYDEATLEPVVTIAVDKILVARRDLDESVVYDLINEILRLRPALASIHPGLLQQLSEEFDASRSQFILHSGTQSYLQRSEPTFIERYSGVAEVLVTLMIAAFSASIAGVRIYNRRRKNRIDRFYAAAIDIRNSFDPSASDADRREASDRLRGLQDEAFELLVDEKLAADESFRIFITLSNDVLDLISRNSRK